MLLFLKLADVLTVVLLHVLRRSNHPLAQRLLTPIDPPQDYSVVAPGVLGATSRRLAAFAATCCVSAALMFFIGQRLSSHLVVQVAVIILNVILVIAAFMFALNSAHFAFMAFSKRRRVREAAAGVSPTRPA